MNQPRKVNKWIVTGAVMLGTFLSVMDVSVVNVSLMHMMGNFGQNLSAITWVATSYSIAEIIMLTMAGWWSAIFGRKRFFLASLIIFTIGSILSGTAQTFTQMLVYRVIQGIGGGSLIPLSQAIMRESFPKKEQGMAMAIFGMGVVIAPATGPILGGWLTDHYGWPWIFYINIPICFLALLLVTLFVYDPPYFKRGIKHIDTIGIMLLTIGLTGLQIILERGQENNWFDSPAIFWGTLFTILSLVIFIFWEWFQKEPIINLRLLKNLPLSLGSSVGLIFGIALFGTTFVLPSFTQQLLGYSAYQSGLVLLPRALALFFCMPFVGWLYNHVDTRWLLTIGVAFILWSYYDLSHLSLHMNFWSFVPMLVIMGIGMPFMFVTLTTISLSTVPLKDMTAASSLYNMFRRIGGNIGYALIATMMERRIAFHQMHLTESINPLSVTFRHWSHTLSQKLAGTANHEITTQGYALLSHTIHNQAAMMAYNDTSWLLGMMFLMILPLIWFFPKK